ncbi:unnamed protein product [Rotaria sp. Silwood2]|nr:unnamed protein product [Rotaria sp. Silwood2]CAF3034086.1 unnamed protein product [Rotaria sp. Silwood2]CAF3083188.1 unnamed protein product [Rotaria sp. Silwood2]
MLVQKQDLSRGSIVGIRNKFGINLSNQNLPSTKTTNLSKELNEAIEQFLNNNEMTRLAPDKKRIIDSKQDFQQHMKLVRVQLKNAELIRQLALTNDNVAIIQLDWLENYHVKQARQECCKIPLRSSFEWLSDETNHQSESTWTASHHLLDEFFNGKPAKQIIELNFISDSPSSQCRNETTICYLKYYARIKNMTIRWLFLESGHGQGIVDGVGSVSKRLFDNTIRLNTDESFQDVEGLMNKIKDFTKIRLHFYKKENINLLRKEYYY